MGRPMIPSPMNPTTCAMVTSWGPNWEELQRPGGWSNTDPRGESSHSPPRRPPLTAAPVPATLPVVNSTRAAWPGPGGGPAPEGWARRPARARDLGETGAAPRLGRLLRSLAPAWEPAPQERGDSGHEQRQLPHGWGHPRPPHGGAHPDGERHRADRGRPRRAPRRAPRLELRVPRPLHPLGHGLRGSAARARGPRPPAPRRGAEPARPGPAPRHRPGAPEPRSDRGLRADGRRGRGDGARAGGRLRGGGPEPPALGVLAAARADRALPARRGAAPRALRRLRLRPRVPVRADPRAPAAPGRPARSRPLPARRADHRGPPPRGGPAAPLRLRGGRPRHRRPAARRRRPRVRSWAPPRCRARATTSPARTPRSSAWPARRSSAAISSRWCPARPSSSPAPRRRRSCSAACASATPRPTAS